MFWSSLSLSTSFSSCNYSQRQRQLGSFSFVKDPEFFLYNEMEKRTRQITFSKVFSSLLVLYIFTIAIKLKNDRCDRVCNTHFFSFTRSLLFTFSSFHAKLIRQLGNARQLPSGNSREFVFDRR